MSGRFGSGPVTDRVLVFAGGDRCTPAEVADLPRDAVIIAADSGAEHAVALGWPVHLLVGDLDSIPSGLVGELQGSGTMVERHPEAKDRTDLALALDAAMARGAAAVTVVGGHGGRLDHLVANVALLASPDYASIELDARLGPARLTVVRGRRTLAGRPGDLVTLLALGGPALGVSTTGLLFPLQEAVLQFGASVGVSNEMTAPVAEVSVRSGVVVVVQPGEQGVLAARRGSAR
ncbi:MAG: thiamine diphosphokinase [Acidimicrobiales bacterium]